jgi:hypothetical protein
MQIAACVTAMISIFASSVLCGEGAVGMARTTLVGLLTLLISHGGVPDGLVAHHYGVVWRNKPHY